MPWRTVIGWLGLLFAAAVVVAAGIYVVFWPLSDLIARHDVGAIIGPHRAAALKHHAAALQSARDAARGRLLTFGAGLFAAGALVYTARNFTVSRRNVELTEQGQVTDRYTKAIEQLGSDKGLDVRIGGIYALERIAHDSARDHPIVMEVLTAFVREHSREQSPLAEAGAQTPERSTRSDIQAAVTVIGRRNRRHDRQSVNLGAVALAGADLTGADLAGADLADADLTGAIIAGADLADANLISADLTGADLSSADLSDADLTSANLTRADLISADLTRADLFGADLTGATLFRADLSNADLSSANLTGADLGGADLTSAILGPPNADPTRGGMVMLKLQRVDLAAKPTRMNITRMRLKRARSRSTITGADLTDTRLGGSRLRNVDLTGVNLTSADLTYTDLTGAIWHMDVVVPEGWQRDTDSGRMKRAATNSGGAAAE